MKRIFVIIIAMLSSMVLHAQEYEYILDRGQLNEIMRIGAVLFAFYFTATFIITVIKLFLDYRLKQKILDKHIPDELVRSLLTTNNKDMKYVAMRWLVIFSGFAVGLLVVSLTPPFGIHSLAIIAFSLAIAYLWYFVFIKRSEK